MARVKKTSSPILERAAARAASLESIDPALDLGNGLTLASYRTALTDATTKLSTYNTLLSQVDEAQNTFREAERALGDQSDRMLAGVASKFGRDSSQYEMGGGTRKSERRRHTASAPAPATSGS